MAKIPIKQYIQERKLDLESYNELIVAHKASRAVSKLKRFIIEVKARKRNIMPKNVEFKSELDAIIKEAQTLLMKSWK